MKKKNILIGIIILILIIILIMIWRFYIGFSFKSLYKYKKATRNVDNVEISLIDIQKRTGKIIDDDTTKKKILDILSNVKVKNTYDYMIGKAYIFEIKDTNNEYNIRISVMPTQINIDNKAYDFVKNDEYKIFNAIEDIIEQYI